MMQVMSEAADACAQLIVKHCASLPLIFLLCDVICEDRSPKLRHHCSAYLLQVGQAVAVGFLNPNP